MTDARERCLCKCVRTMVKPWKYLSFHAQNQTQLWNELLASDLLGPLTSRPTHVDGEVLLKTEGRHAGCQTQ
ncbi:hypothetical protein MUK42_18006 [Musa troglodytarum]|uniref:Uncharacterized protein n=1 Tax=Musa troglodytarum TaxID=320322 RepID=A0A9E7KW02_9LILI|nr:hypothetical protein MUK42_18006 [Musa troglodytarum]